MNHQKPSKATPVLVGGAVLGVASAIPLLDLLNCACCALVVGGGVLTSYLYIRNLPSGFTVTYGDGALLGLLAGLVGAVVSTVVSIPFRLVTGELSAGMLQQVLEEMRSDPNVPPEIISLVESFASPEGFGAAAILLSLVFLAVIYPIFAAIGGCLGVALFQRTPTPPPPSVGGPGGYQPPPSPPTPPSPPPPSGTVVT